MNQVVNIRPDALLRNPQQRVLYGIATITADDPLLAQLPGAVFLVRIAATQIFPNCSRYVHRMNLVEPSTGTAAYRSLFS